MQIPLSRIWTQVAVSISNDNNYYTIGSYFLPCRFFDMGLSLGFSYSHHRLLMQCDWSVKQQLWFRSPSQHYSYWCSNTTRRGGGRFIHFRRDLIAIIASVLKQNLWFYLLVFCCWLRVFFGFRNSPYASMSSRLFYGISTFVGYLMPNLF